ncbi:MAG: hypothetical protein CVT96_10200 [Bacteroidetes bacterium HGW-Bacteroidetes-13]|nr:MAG: hypothetical protein CVT96_10200 [Bacteroidetes bacterium HGW-Bacteroidetes-13]
MLLIPILAVSQSNESYAVVENSMITANPAKIKEFEAGIAKHNKKFHAIGAYGARVYYINNGINTGKYIWSMGPLPWSDFDKRPENKEHDDDWNANVLPYIMAEGETTYWKFEAKHSHFPKDFALKKLVVDVYDIKRFDRSKALKLLEQVHKVMVEKMPTETFAIYTNEFSNTFDGKDLAYVSFFDKSSWLGEDNDFPKKYDAVFGEGSFAHFLKDWEEVSLGSQTELWNLRPDLSGLNAEVKATDRK